MKFEDNSFRFQMNLRRRSVSDGNCLKLWIDLPLLFLYWRNQEFSFVLYIITINTNTTITFIYNKLIVLFQFDLTHRMPPNGLGSSKLMGRSSIILIIICSEATKAISQIKFQARKVIVIILLITVDQVGRGSHRLGISVVHLIVVAQIRLRLDGTRGYCVVCTIFGIICRLRFVFICDQIRIFEHFQFFNRLR